MMGLKQHAQTQTLQRISGILSSWLASLNQNLILLKAPNCQNPLETISLQTPLFLTFALFT